MPAARYQHGAVFVGARLHISGGAVGGGRMVDDASSIVVLDTAAGAWCTQGKASKEDAPEKEWERRWGSQSAADAMHEHLRWLRCMKRAAWPALQLSSHTRKLMRQRADKVLRRWGAVLHALGRWKGCLSTEDQKRERFGVCDNV